MDSTMTERPLVAAVYLVGYRLYAVILISSPHVTTVISPRMKDAACAKFRLQSQSDKAGLPPRDGLTGVAAQARPLPSPPDHRARRAFGAK